MGLRDNRRIGKFYIGWNVINDYPELAKSMLKDVIVIKATEMYDMNAIEYVALSEQFEEVALGSLAPVYEPCFVCPSLEQAGCTQFEGWHKLGVLRG